MKTDELIEALSRDAPLRWTLGRMLAAAAIVATLIAGTTFFVTMGFREDIAAASESVRFLFKLAFTGTLAIAALGAVLRAARPGASLGIWAWALLLAPLLLIGALALEMAVMPQSTWMPRLVGHNARHCLTLIPLLAAAPLACLLYALSQGAPTRPGVAGLMAGLAASGIAALFYATNCTDDSPLFVATWYPLAIAIVALAGYLLGSKFLRW